MNAGKLETSTQLVGLARARSPLSARDFSPPAYVLLPAGVTERAAAYLREWSAAARFL